MKPTTVQGIRVINKLRMALRLAENLGNTAARSDVREKARLACERIHNEFDRMGVSRTVPIFEPAQVHGLSGQALNYLYNAGPQTTYRVDFTFGPEPA